MKPAELTCTRLQNLRQHAWRTIQSYIKPGAIIIFNIGKLV